MNHYLIHVKIGYIPEAVNTPVEAVVSHSSLAMLLHAILVSIDFAFIVVAWQGDTPRYNLRKILVNIVL